MCLGFESLDLKCFKSLRPSCPVGLREPGCAVRPGRPWQSGHRCCTRSSADWARARRSAACTPAALPRSAHSAVFRTPFLKHKAILKTRLIFIYKDKRTISDTGAEGLLETVTKTLLDI